MKHELDCSEAYSKHLCLDFLVNMAAAVGIDHDEIKLLGGREPLRTLRQIVRVAAVRAGFSPYCIAEVCECSPATIRASINTISRRSERELDGQKMPQLKAQGCYPILPVIERVNKAAKEWFDGLPNSGQTKTSPEETITRIEIKKETPPDTNRVGTGKTNVMTFGKTSFALQL